MIKEEEEEEEENYGFLLVLKVKEVHLGNTNSCLHCVL